MLSEQYTEKRQTQTIEDISSLKARIASVSAAIKALTAKATEQARRRDLTQSDPDIDEILVVEDFVETSRSEECPELVCDENPEQLRPGRNIRNKEQDQHHVGISDAEAPEILYQWFVQTFMLTILENSFNQRGYFRIRPKEYCTLCTDDETMNETAKAKKWEAGSALTKHMRDSVHSGAARFKRQA